MLLEGRSRDAKWGRFAQVVRPECPAQRLAIRDLAREQADLDVQVAEAIGAVLKGATTGAHKVLQSLANLQLQLPNASQISFEPRHKAALVGGAQLMGGIHGLDSGQKRLAPREQGPKFHLKIVPQARDLQSERLFPDPMVRTRPQARAKTGQSCRGVTAELRHSTPEGCHLFHNRPRFDQLLPIAG